MNIIIINGEDNCGKDTTTHIFAQITKCPVENFSTVDKIKDVLAQYFNWDGVKNKKSRKLISNIKKSLKEYNNFPLIELDKAINTFKNKYQKNDDIYFFVHSRELDENIEIKKKYENCSILAIGITGISEELFKISDYKIYNSGSITDLYESVSSFQNEYRRKNNIRIKT